MTTQEPLAMGQPKWGGITKRCSSNPTSVAIHHSVYVGGRRGTLQALVETMGVC